MAKDRLDSDLDSYFAAKKKDAEVKPAEGAEAAVAAVAAAEGEPTAAAEPAANPT